MTGPELLAKLKASGTGELKIAKLFDLLGSKFTVAELLDTMRAEGEYLKSTLQKAIGFLREAGVTPPGTVEVNGEYATKIAAVEKKLAAVIADRDAIATNLADAESSLTVIRKQRDELAAHVADLEKKLAAATAAPKGK